MLHSGRVAFGEMDEVVFGGPAPRWNWPPERTGSMPAVCASPAAVLGVANALRERSPHPDSACPYRKSTGVNFSS
jgi:hypothetical protein